MNEITPTLPASLDAALNGFYAAQRPAPAFAARLEAQLRQRHTELISARARFSPTGAKNAFVRLLHTRSALAVLVVVLALLIMTGVVYAVGRLTGFIPGFGFTSEEGSVYVLAGQVESTSGGITLHVDQAVSDDKNFWVELTASGLPDVKESSNVFVLLPDGEKIEFLSGGSSPLDDGKTRLSYLFPPLTGQPGKVTLLIGGLTGNEFSLPLELRPVKAGEVIPVPAGGAVRLQSEDHDGVRLVLDDIAADSSKTVFQVSLQYDQPNTMVASQWNVTLGDESGALYPLTDVTPDTMTSGDTHVYQTVPFTGKEHLVLTLAAFPSADTLPMQVGFSPNAPSFTFVPGPNPAVGQKWELNQTLSADGFDLKMVSATLTDEPGLVFEVEPGPSVTGVMFYSSDPIVTGASGGVPVQEGNVTSEVKLAHIPTQPFKVRLMWIYYQATGPWQIQWQPPAAPAASASASPTVTPTQVPTSTATSLISDPLVLEVLHLAQKFDAPYQQGPGWVHLVRETTSQPRAGQTYPLPYLRSELWYELDADGYVTRFVWLDYDAAGQVVQQSATVGNYSVNFTTGDSGLNPDGRYHFSADMLTHDLNAAVTNGTPVTQEDVTCADGSSCLLITMQSNFPAPVQNPGEPQAFAGSGRRVWIDLETGLQVKDQTFWILEDGGESIISTQSTVLVERLVVPPQAILDILSRVIVP